MESAEIQTIAFTIILHAGNGRTLVHEAFPLMRAGKYEEAEAKLQEANDALVEAHNAQTDLLHRYANGEDINMEIIMVHAQDHLMTSTTLREMAMEMLEMYKVVKGN
ncbi:PTS cellobiose transporter subunit IIA [Aerococcus agrisoli]|uniref:PTS cellobiose transporter subunit IIA n=1 Tax=Aerococcus agrisoli TaxID=2487350 RepID=A0A3N4G7B3_9LACT|nr:PTS cellobiose transporter subunit IIA [Aerococcus agrisoli]RPA58215.1 PTS cellobiose transporter subunit IIA [Aerococcus agrisoli]